MGYTKPTYLNIRAAYDIETTKFMSGAIIYSHMFIVDGKHHHFRTTDEMMCFLQELRNTYNLNNKNRLAIYVHNLDYEWYFIKHLMPWEPDSVFAIGKSKKVIKAYHEGIEFRCSNMLTGKKLAQLGDDLGYPKGDLDYDIIRHHETPLTDDEMNYIITDVDIIDKTLEQYLTVDTIESIPMTSTGFIRREMKRSVGNSKSDRKTVRDIKMSADDYFDIKELFRGGYVHANAKYTGKIVRNVNAHDLGSSYPSSMVQFTYPMTTFTQINNPKPEDLDLYLTKCCILDITFHHFNCEDTMFPPLSASKCLELVDPIIDNGRVVSAELIRVMINEVDFNCIERKHTWDALTINKLKTAEPGYLPWSFVQVLLNAYNKKTSLKGIDGAEFEYLLAKCMINAGYGMVSSDPIYDEMMIHPDGTIESIKLSPSELEEAIHKYNTSKTRFRSFAWGAWVTAYSRSILLNTIYDLEDEGIEVMYCDTDSIYYVDNHKAQRIFDDSNDLIYNNIKAAMQHHNQPMSLTHPANKKGEEFQLGLWENDTDGQIIDKFKTLGAKRYMKAGLMWDKDSQSFTYQYKMTTSGVNKSKGLKYLKTLNNDPFKAFSDGVTIPKGHSGKNRSITSDDVVAGVMTDYLGNQADVYQEGYVILEETDYHLTISEEYDNYISNL